MPNANCELFFQKFDLLSTQYNDHQTTFSPQLQKSGKNCKDRETFWPLGNHDPVQENHPQCKMFYKNEMSHETHCNLGNLLLIGDRLNQLKMEDKSISQYC